MESEEREQILKDSDDWKKLVERVRRKWKQREIAQRGIRGRYASDVATRYEIHGPRYDSDIHFPDPILIFWSLIRPVLHALAPDSAVSLT